jgi:ABC-type multidrug transport system fused ATPase/permease subunit
MDTNSRYKGNERIQLLLGIWRIISKDKKIQIVILVGFQIMLAIIEISLTFFFAFLISSITFGSDIADFPAIFKPILGAFENQLFSRELLIWIFSGFVAISILRVVLSGRAMSLMLRSLAKVSLDLYRRELRNVFFNNKFQMIDTFKVSDALVRGTDFLVVNFFGSFLILLVEIIGLIWMASIFLLLDVSLTLMIIGYLFVASLFIHFRTTKPARDIGITQSHVMPKLNQKLNEYLNLWVEIFLNPSRNQILINTEKLKREMISIRREQTWLPIKARLNLEFLFYFGIGAFFVITLLFSRTNEAFGLVLVTFVIIISRAIPAVLRAQVASINMNSGYGEGQNARYLINSDKQSAESISIPKFASSVLRHDSEFKPRFAIKISNVFFHYENSRMLLKNISLVINEGEIVVIMGPSGSGKTTLIKLILGILSPVKGEIIAIANEAQKSCLAKLEYAYVPQSVNLIQGSLIENITLMEHDNTDFEKAIKAIEESQLLDFYEELSKDGTLHNSKGEIKASGGQKQKIGVARALYCEPHILIMDEPTSALDQESTLAIMKTLRNLTKGRAIVIVTHDQRVANFADKILTLAT